MSDISIRRATPEDLHAIDELLRSAGLDSEGVEKDLPHFIVAEEDGRVIGVAGLEPYGPDALFRSLAVAPTHRSLGIGDRLLQRAADDARRLGAIRLLLLTTTAEDYFQKRGFTRIDRQSVAGMVLASSQFRGACPLTAACMMKATGKGPSA